jgi:hypothetical protein
LASEFKSGWVAASGIGAVVVTLIAEMVLSPPTLWREAGDQPAVLHFFVTVIVAAGLSSVLAGRKPERRATFMWLVPLGLLFTVTYFVLSAQFSCPFAGGRMTTGWTYLPAAADYVAKNPAQGCSLLIADFTGDTDRIWPRGEILMRWLLLLVTYMLAVTFLATTVVRVMQHLRGN